MCPCIRAGTEDVVHSKSHTRTAANPDIGSKRGLGNPHTGTVMYVQALVYTVPICNFSEMLK